MLVFVIIVVLSVQ